MYSDIYSICNVIDFTALILDWFLIVKNVSPKKLSKS